MTTSSYQKLIADIYALANLPNTMASTGAADLAVDGVNFSLSKTGAGDDEGMTMLCEFGTLPEVNRARVLEKLLEANLNVFGRDAPVFALGPDFRGVLLARRISIGKASALDVMNIMSRHAAHAMEWRKTYYLDSPGPQLQLRSAEKDRFKLNQLMRS